MPFTIYKVQFRVFPKSFQTQSRQDAKFFLEQMYGSKLLLTDNNYQSYQSFSINYLSTLKFFIGSKLLLTDNNYQSYQSFSINYLLNLNFLLVKDW